MTKGRYNFLRAKGLFLLANALEVNEIKWHSILYKELGILVDNDPGIEAYEKLAQFQTDHEQELLEDSMEAKPEKLRITFTKFIYIFAALWSLFSIVYILSVTFGEIPADNIRFADTILGFLLGTVISTLLNFFFGASLRDHSGDKK